MHFLQAINSDLSVLIVCNKTGGTIKGDIKKKKVVCKFLYQSFLICRKKNRRKRDKNCKKSFKHLITLQITVHGQFTPKNYTKFRDRRRKTLRAFVNTVLQVPKVFLQI